MGISYDLLRSLGAIPTEERVVRYERIITTAGVSAGIDKTLNLVVWELGEDVGKAAQLVLEYEPQPPFDTGSPIRMNWRTIIISIHCLSLYIQSF